MELKEAINQATILNIGMNKFLESVHNAGFSAVELRFEKIKEYLQECKINSIESLKELLDKYQLKVLSINSLEDFSLCCNELFQSKILKEIELMMTYCNGLDCSLIVAVPSFFSMDDDVPKKDEINKKTIERLSKIAEVLSLKKINLGFEPLGFNDCSIRTVRHACEVINVVKKKHSNVGLVLDTCHFFTALNPMSSIKDINNLLLVHINDLKCNIESHNLSWVKDKDRIMPGCGNFPIKKLMAEIENDLHYTGYVSVELFNEDFWHQNPGEVAKIALNSLQNTLEH